MVMRTTQIESHKFTLIHTSVVHGVDSLPFTHMCDRPFREPAKLKSGQAGLNAGRNIPSLGQPSEYEEQGIYYALNQQRSIQLLLLNRTSKHLQDSPTDRSGCFLSGTLGVVSKTRTRVLSLEAFYGCAYEALCSSRLVIGLTLIIPKAPTPSEESSSRTRLTSYIRLAPN